MTGLAKILLTIAAFQYGVAPQFADFTDTHVFHPEWPPHARMHLVWLLMIGALLATYVVVLIWGPARDRAVNLRHASVLGCIVLLAFFIAAFSRDLYGGALTDVEQPIRLLGMDANVVAFSAASALQVIGTLIAWRET